MTVRTLALLLVALSLGSGAACDAGPTATANGAGDAPPGPVAPPASVTPPANSVDASAGGESTGSLSAQITLPGGQDIGVLLWKITGGGAAGAVQTGLVDVSKSPVASFLVGNLPSAMGYQIALSATASDGSVVCAGAASFDVAPRATTPVAVSMACNVATLGSQVTLPNGSTFNCAAVSSLTATPAETTVGASVTVSASASGPDPGGLSYSWAASSGTFDKPKSPTAQFTCAAQGLATLTMTVADGPVPSGSSCNPTLTTRATTVRCDSVITAAVPGLPPWAIVLLGFTVMGVGSLAAGRRRLQTRFSEDRSPGSRNRLACIVEDGCSVGAIEGPRSKGWSASSCRTSAPACREQRWRSRAGRSGSRNRR